jgi:hypothetical protein
MIYTTLNKIRECSPCTDGWEKLLTHLGKTKADDEPLSFETIIDSNGMYDAQWCIRAAPEYSREWRIFALWCAREVQHLMTDPRSINALDVAERYANGDATLKDLDAAVAAAVDAALDAALDAEWAASRAERAAGDEMEKRFREIISNVD